MWTLFFSVRMSLLTVCESYVQFGLGFFVIFSLLTVCDVDGM